MVNLAKNISFIVEPFEPEDIAYALEDVPGWKSTGLDEEQIAEACRAADEQVYQVMESLGMVQMTIDLDDDE